MHSKNPITKSFAAIATIAALAQMQSARAAIIQVSFRADVSGYTDSSGFFNRAGVLAGDRIVGSFEYDTAALPTSSSSVAANYMPLNYQFSIGGDKVNFVWQGFNGLSVLKNFPGVFDQFDFGAAGGYLSNNVTGETIAQAGGTMWVAD